MPGAFRGTRGSSDSTFGASHPTQILMLEEGRRNHHEISFLHQQSGQQGSQPFLPIRLYRLYALVRIAGSTFSFTRIAAYLGSSGRLLASEQRIGPDKRACGDLMGRLGNVGNSETMPNNFTVTQDWRVSSTPQNWPRLREWHPEPWQRCRIVILCGSHQSTGLRLDIQGNKPVRIPNRQVPDSHSD